MPLLDGGDFGEELKNSAEFGLLGIEIVDDPTAADVFLEMRHDGAGDFSYTVKYRKTGEILLSNGANALSSSQAQAAELIKALKALRAGTPGDAHQIAPA